MSYIDNPAASSGGTLVNDGTGSAGEVAFWIDATTLAGDAVFGWDAALDRLGIGLSSGMTAGVQIRRTDTSVDALRVETDSGDGGGLKTRFSVENNALQANVDVNFRNCVVELGNVSAAVSGSVTQDFYSPAASAYQPWRVWQPGSTTLRSAEINQAGKLDLHVGGLSSVALTVDVFGDANARFRIQETGQLDWGAGGASAVDTNLYRDAANVLATDDQFRSTVATGTAPFVVASTTLVTNLNADLLDGLHAAAFQPIDDDLTQLSLLSSGATTGFVSRTSAGPSYAARTFQTANALLTIGNPAGAAGDPLFTVVNSAIDHNSLANLLVGDAHTHYFLLAGRAGGQVASGGTATANNLELRSHSGTFALTDAGRIRARGLIDLIGSAVTQSGSGSSLVAFSQTVTVPTTVQLTGLVGFNFTPTFSYDTGIGINDDIVAFNAEPVFQPTADPSDSGFIAGFRSRPTYKVAAGVSATVERLYGYRARPSTDIGAGGVINVGTEMFAYKCWGPGTDFIGSGLTIQKLGGLDITWPSGSATITEAVGIEIGNPPVATTRLSLRSSSAVTQMRHAGIGVFGANAAPANTSVGLEVQSTTRAFLLPRLTTTQRDALTAVNGMVIYNTTVPAVQARVGGAWVGL